MPQPHSTERDALALTRATSMLRQTVSDNRDATLNVLGRVVDGIAALLEYRVAEGYRLDRRGTAAGARRTRATGVGR